jgi:hypothetical protein
MVECIHYSGGYKYMLKQAVTLPTEVCPDEAKSIGDFVKLSVDGVLEVRHGYAWDGPSGPTIDTKNFMRGALVHDALYQLMREAGLDKAKWRKTADVELVRLCREDGMSRVRAWWVLTAVRLFADRSASIGGGKPEITAPRRCVPGGRPG